MSKDLIELLKQRFEEHMERHPDINWKDVAGRLAQDAEKLSILIRMEESGGEPDVIGYDHVTERFLFVDCSKESPSGRRSLCYDMAALNARKENKPNNSVMEMAREIGIGMLDEEMYRKLQELGEFDTKTSSWIQTPERIRKLGGALFADYRYKTVFVYHNGASSYYAARGFRGFVYV
ncbi:MAG: DUF4256 domain-containing protein [Flavobacteriales bacterium]|nr:DUF4256 domain-containing protein [Flavobacteriales bacterium]